MEFIVAPDEICAVEYANNMPAGRLGHCIIQCGRCFNPNSELFPEVNIEIIDGAKAPGRSWQCAANTELSPRGNSPSE